MNFGDFSDAGREGKRLFCAGSWGGWEADRPLQKMCAGNHGGRLNSGIGLRNAIS